MKKLAFLLIFTVLFCGTVCYADEGVAPTVVTEYYSEDLISPIKDDGTLAASLTVTPPDIKAKAAVLYEPVTGTFIVENAPHEKLAPASITKVMSLLLIFEAIDSGRLDINAKVTASEHAASMGGSQIWLEPGETMTVHELLKAAVIASANDATVALAEAVSGSEEVFTARMNERAKELKMNDTTFKNCTGLDEDGHLTSACDVALMSAELIKHQRVFEYSTVWMDTLRGGELSLVNTNKLVRYYEGCKGLKTGTTSVAGSCLTAVAEKNSMTLIAVVMGAKNTNDRFAVAKALLDHGFANYSLADVRVPDEQLCRVKLSGGMARDVGSAAPGSKQLLIDNSDDGDLTVTAEYDKNLTAPIEKGAQIGVARITKNGKVLGSVKLIATEAVEKKTFWGIFAVILKYLGAGRLIPRNF